MIEHDFDIPFIADLALREKQIQQNYRPIIAVHKWFARRPGTLFRGLILSEFGRSPLKDAYFKSNCFSGLQIADPFMGGGTPLIEANRVGCDVIGCDINPMAYWIVKEELEYLNIDKYDACTQLLRSSLEKELGGLYRTRCTICGRKDAHAKYFLWVKQQRCPFCDTEIDLFPGYLIAKDTRHPKNVFVCHKCGELTEVEDRKNPGSCPHCGSSLNRKEVATRNRVRCPSCGQISIFPDATKGAPRHRLFAIEYFCEKCKKMHTGRFFKKPDNEDFIKLQRAQKEWFKIKSIYTPQEEIPKGDETSRLHRWGYRHYYEMFNYRQLLALEKSAGWIGSLDDERLKRAMAINLSDLLRYQNMLCRYDSMALKSLDIFSVHGFPVGLIQCESNFLGILDSRRSIPIGSGGWANIIQKFRKAKSYCIAPFEVSYQSGKKRILSVPGEWIGEHLNGVGKDEKQRKIDIRCGTATTMEFRKQSLDAVLTDPPYFGNVQYAELMDFCYVWLRRLLQEQEPIITDKPSTRDPDELTCNENMGRGLDHFCEGLSIVFQRMARALKIGAPLTFTYHHNDISAYCPVAVAFLDSGLVCSASLPCPSEMGASIHINGTGSSIIDTVFVCRSTGSVLREWLPETVAGVVDLVGRDLEKLKIAGVKLTQGDLKCIAYGHLTRLAIWALRHGWSKTDRIQIRINRVKDWFDHFSTTAVIRSVADFIDEPSSPRQHFLFREKLCHYGEHYEEIPF
jgi:adenine-specific DNA methylase